MSYSPYAELAALADYLGVEESTITDVLSADEVTRLLTRASTLIDTIPTLASFDIDTDGIPTDGDVAAALSNAVCAQVEFWFEIGGGAKTPNTEGEASTILRLQAAGKIGTVDIPAPREFAPRAIDELRSVGLLRSGVSGHTGAWWTDFFEE